MADLPAPDPDAAAHSGRVAAAIRDEIAAAGGWIPFARYMALALYAPGLGYYAAGATKLGPAGDFVTAPEMTPLFGAALAREVGALLLGSGGSEVVELGAGSGKLAASLLAALAKEGPLPARYAILEPSPDLRERQRATIAAAVPALVERVAWLHSLPDTIDGAVIANEVLDAIPVHLLHRAGDCVHERGVTIVGEALAPRFGLAFADGPAPAALATLAHERFPQEGDYASEVNPAAEALVAEVAARLRSGAALLIDYGFPAREYYHPQRSAGTLMCHYRHHAHADPFFYPGLCDITAHVDFSAMARAGGRAGLQVAGYTSQASFLVDCGILDGLARAGPPESRAYIAAAGAVQRLLSPAEMGELFKVLALARTPGLRSPGFAHARGRHRL